MNKDSVPQVLPNLDSRMRGARNFSTHSVDVVMPLDNPVTGGRGFPNSAYRQDHFDTLWLPITVIYAHRVDFHPLGPDIAIDSLLSSPASSYGDV